LKSVYKYRSSGENFERDLESIRKNCFWASGIDSLNDPCEAFISTKNFQTQLGLIIKIFNKKQDSSASDEVINALNNVIERRKVMGIYSLSQTYNHELLWAHYANSHSGFCIEYDLDLLLPTNKMDKLYSFPIKYSNKIPQVDISDISGKAALPIIQKLAGTKSKSWSYEEEYRLITDQSGPFQYNHNAITAIYFGLRMEQDKRKRIMGELAGRGISYYQIIQIEGTYNFERELIEGGTDNEITYLTQLPNTKGETELIKFQIRTKNYKRMFKMGEVTVDLEKPIEKAELFAIANNIKGELFYEAEKIFMWYYLPNQKDDFAPWATTNFANGDFNVQINDFIELE
jgi:hypothetical protein